MKKIVLDFETFYSTEFSLTRQSFVEYINDARFETISVAVKIDDAPVVVRFGEDQVREYLRSIDWSDAAVIAHNGNEFDFPLLVWQFDCHPKLFLDTLCLARAKWQSTGSMSLESLAVRMSFSEKRKGSFLVKMKGRRYEDLDLEEMVALKEYNANDVELTRELFDTCMADVPRQELLVMDMTARMTCYPKLQIDSELIERTKLAAAAEKEALLDNLARELGTSDHSKLKAMLASSAKFAKVLQSLGVEPPLKISKTTGNTTFALAKTDEEFAALAGHPDTRVQAAVAARLGVKSTILETRLQTMEDCARTMGGVMPVPLAYHAATTGRWGGRVWNPQNLPRINKKKPRLTDALRRALVAPPGYKVVASDMSNIELRVNHHLWGVESTAQLFARDPKADLYKDFAAKSLYSKPEQEVTESERHLAKQAQLGLGFGAGKLAFQRLAQLQGGIRLSLSDSEDVVNKWRNRYSDIVRGWKKCHTAISAMHTGAVFSVDPRGLVSTRKGELELPSGRVLYYPDLWALHVDGRTQFKYGVDNKASFINGPRLCENIVQAIARDVLAEACLKIKHRYGYEPVLLVHDEYVTVVKEDEAELALERINEVLRERPVWLPGIVLWSEGGIADNYGDT